MPLIRPGGHPSVMDRRTQGDVPLDQRERRMIGAGLLVLFLALGSAASAFFLLWQRKESRAKEDGARAALTAVASREAETAAQLEGARAAVGGTADGDDLKIIEGIGPRIEAVLKAAGVTTFAEVAELRAGRLETIMREAGTRMAKPDTWPEQARLAAAGDWQALRDFQDELKRGVPAS